MNERKYITYNTQRFAKPAYQCTSLSHLCRISIVSHVLSPTSISPSSKSSFKSTGGGSMPKGDSLREKLAGRMTSPVTAPATRISPIVCATEESLLVTALKPRLCVRRESAATRVVAARWMLSSDRLRMRVVMAQTKLL